MFLILLGPDGAGKTTLAKRLAKSNKAMYIKRDQPKNDDDRRNMVDSYLRIAPGLNNVIYDRYIYCELVYGPIIRNEHIISDEDMQRIEDMLLRKGAIIIHCTDTLDNLWERCTRRGEDYVTDKETLGKIRQGYYDVLSKTKLPVLEYRIGTSIFGM